MCGRYPLLPAGVRFSEDNAIDAFGKVWKELVVRIKGRRMEADR